MLPVAIAGFPTSHGGMITPTASHTFVSGSLVLRVGDMHACPLRGHGTTPVVTGSPTFTVEGKPAAHVGSVTGCGAQIVTGSPTVSTT